VISNHKTSKALLSEIGLSPIPRLQQFANSIYAFDPKQQKKLAELGIFGLSPSSLAQILNSKEHEK